MHTQCVSAFCFRTPEQRVKVVNFDVCQNAQKLIGYHSNRPLYYHKTCLFVVLIHVTTYAKRLTKIGLVVAEILGQICRFLPSRPKRCSCYPRNLSGYWNECHLNCVHSI